MKALCAVAAVGLCLMGAIRPASAQPWYREGPSYGYEERGPRFREDGGWYRERPRYRRRGFGFNEREYLFCNRDVLRAVRRGEVRSGWEHYQTHGRYEGRRLSC
jgi:hypothetical protein